MPLRRVELQIKILCAGFGREFYSFKFVLPGTASAGMPDTPSIDVLLVATFPLEFPDETHGLIRGARAVLGNDIHQRALDVPRHPLGIAADIDMRAFGKPRPQLSP